MGTLFLSVVWITTMAGWLCVPVSIIWLVMLGQWWAIGLAVLSLASPMVLGLAMTPAMLLVAPAMTSGRELRPAALAAVMFPHHLYMAALSTVWFMGVFTALLSGINPLGARATPLALLAFAVGTGPWKYMASHDRGSENVGSFLIIFFMSLAGIAVVAYYLFQRTSDFAPMWFIFGTIMFLAATLTSAMAFITARAGAD